MAIPNNASETMAAKKCSGAVRELLALAHTGSMRNADVTEKTMRAASGPLFNPGIGIKVIMPPIRAMTRRKPAKACAGTLTLSRIDAQVGEKQDGVRNQMPQHPRRENQHAQHKGRQTRDSAESGVLNGCGHLNQVDDNADKETNQQKRCGQDQRCGEHLPHKLDCHFGCHEGPLRVKRLYE